MEELTTGSRLALKFAETEAMNIKPSRTDYRKASDEDVVLAKRHVAVAKGMETKELDNKAKVEAYKKGKTRKQSLVREESL
jgi:hypothetical protein